MTIPISLKPKFTLAVFAVLLNYAGWRAGVFCHQFGGDPAQYGAELCRATYALRYPVIAGAIIYACIRRFWLKKHQWDFYGPALAVLAALLVWYENQMSIKY